MSSFDFIGIWCIVNTYLWTAQVVYSMYRIGGLKTLEDGAEVLRKMQSHLKYYDDLLAKGGGDFLLGKM